MCEIHIIIISVDKPWGKPLTGALRVRLTSVFSEIKLDMHAH